MLNFFCSCWCIQIDVLVKFDVLFQNNIIWCIDLEACCDWGNVKLSNSAGKLQVINVSQKLDLKCCQILWSESQSLLDLIFLLPMIGMIRKRDAKTKKKYRLFFCASRLSLISSNISVILKTYWVLCLESRWPLWNQIWPIFNFNLYVLFINWNASRDNPRCNNYTMLFP